MNKKELINTCIDLSYNVSVEEMRAAIMSVSGERYMEVRYPKKIWEALANKLSSIISGENGNKYLFYGSNVEAYRQK